MGTSGPKKKKKTPLATDITDVACVELPAHLQKYVVEQDATLYTPMDHATWRFIMRLSRDFFSKKAHQKYLDGLRETGIDTERIPLISEMDHALRKFGWNAVAVSGFIPPAAFMEFLSLGVLPIACDIRQIDHLAYTPAPDIVHEAAGHAPIITDAEYAKYLKTYGEVARKAIYSQGDMETYLAIRDLSIVKEDPKSTPAQVDAAQKRLDRATLANDFVSELSGLARMNWWTVEYGLVGEIDDPKIYGAGLLSSVAESFHCFDKNVKKIPLTSECIQTTYDITKPQPQLFVAPNFKHLSLVLEEFAQTMGFRQGGAQSMEKALQARTVTTAVLDTGLQISGKVERFRKDKDGTGVSFIKYEGPVQLSFKDEQIGGHGPAYHAQGFSSPLGKIKNQTQSGAERVVIEFESGIILDGIESRTLVKDGVSLLTTYDDCTIKLGDEVLFQPEWGVFDLALGTNIVSVYGGPADYEAYVEVVADPFGEVSSPQKTNLTVKNKPLNEIYSQIRKQRYEDKPDLPLLEDLQGKLEREFPEDWLAQYELIEISKTNSIAAPWVYAARKHLERVSARSSANKELISRGLELL